MNTKDMWTVWDDQGADAPLCYCATRSDAYLVQERMIQIDTFIKDPGEKPDTSEFGAGASGLEKLKDWQP